MEGRKEDSKEEKRKGGIEGKLHCYLSTIVLFFLD
jgi:hypothetical protein